MKIPYRKDLSTGSNEITVYSMKAFMRVIYDALASREQIVLSRKTVMALTEFDPITFAAETGYEAGYDPRTQCYVFDPRPEADDA